MSPCDSQWSEEACACKTKQGDRMRYIPFLPEPCSGQNTARIELRNREADFEVPHVKIRLYIELTHLPLPLPLPLPPSLPPSPPVSGSLSLPCAPAILPTSYMRVGSPCCLDLSVALALPLHLQLMAVFGTPLGNHDTRPNGGTSIHCLAVLRVDRHDFRRFPGPFCRRRN